MPRLAILATAAVLVLAGCGAPDYGGHDSDANSWPKSDESSSSKPSGDAKPQRRSKSSVRPSVRAKPARELLIPPTLAGELLNNNLRVLEPDDEPLPPGLTDVRGAYGSVTRPMYGLVVSAGKPPALRELDRWYRKNNSGLRTVGRATCARFDAPVPATSCWRTDGKLMAGVTGAPDAPFTALARVLSEAWAFTLPTS